MLTFTEQNPNIICDYAWNNRSEVRWDRIFFYFDLLRALSHSLLPNIINQRVGLTAEQSVIPNISYYWKNLGRTVELSSRLETKLFSGGGRKPVRRTTLEIHFILFKETSQLLDFDWLYPQTLWAGLDYLQGKRPPFLMDVYNEESSLSYLKEFLLYWRKSLW